MDDLATRIERVIASVPCGGDGCVPTAERDGDEWHVGHEPCPTCTRPEGEA